MVTSLAPNAAGNYTDITWTFSLLENGGSNLAYDTTGTLTASVSVGTVGSVYSGTFTFDWRPGGNQSQVLAAGTTRINHNSDGTPPAGVNVTGYLPNTGTSSAGGPTSVTDTPTLSTLKVIPGTPTSVAGARVSDTVSTVSWAQTSASNGQPVTDTIQQSVNGGAFAALVTVAATTSVNVSCAANQKLIYQVKGTNTAGDSAFSLSSTALFTTPAAPTSVVATKTGANIVITWTDNVAFTEHQHVVEHGVLSGTITWDGSPLGTVASGSATYTHVSPSPASVHVYRISSKNTDTGALTSSAVVSNTVQLLIAPNAPTVSTLPANTDKASAFVVPWTHNPIDTTTQTAYEFGYSTNGGTTWSSSGKVTSTTSSFTIAGSTYAANVVLTIRVRTWGLATTGGSDGTGASPWSSTSAVTFKTVPVATITSPANASVYAQAALAVQLGFSQAESATFVSAVIGLYSGVTLLEQITSTTVSSTAFVTPVANGSSYTVKATVTDSNGLTCSQVSSTFSVTYTQPQPASVTLAYLSDSGIGQIGLTIPAAGGGFVAAATVTITRTINGVTETVVANYAAASTLTILDTTPTINGSNLYTITTISAIGATNIVTATLTTSEGVFAFLSKGSGYSQIVKFSGKLKPIITATLDSALVKTAGRSRPIGLYSTTGDLVVEGTADVITGVSSSPSDIESLLLTTGKACYRDPTGRRLFGMVRGRIARENPQLAQFTYSVTETS